MVINPKEAHDREIITSLPNHIQGNSVDLSVKEVYRIDGGIKIASDGKRELPPYKKVKPKIIRWKDGLWRNTFVFSPRHLYQVEFVEQVAIPEDMCGLTFLRSSMFKSGASGETGLFDSGYFGGTGMTISVKFKSQVEVGACIAQMVFFSAESYKMYNGIYQGGLWRDALL